MIRWFPLYWLLMMDVMTLMPSQMRRSLCYRPLVDGYRKSPLLMGASFQLDESWPAVSFLL